MPPVAELHCRTALGLISLQVLQVDQTTPTFHFGYKESRSFTPVKTFGPLIPHQLQCTCQLFLNQGIPGLPFLSGSKSIGFGAIFFKITQRPVQAAGLIFAQYKTQCCQIDGRLDQIPEGKFGMRHAGK